MKTPAQNFKDEIENLIQAKLNRSLRRLLRPQSHPPSKTLATASMSLPMVPGLK